MTAGGGLLTSAVPGGAGKTTLLAALLAFLPPGEPIVTVEDRWVLDDALDGRLRPPATLLAHEIGSGPWFAYIWGRDAADFFRLGRLGFRCATCLHADTPDQSRNILRSIGVTDGDLDPIRLELYMRAVRREGRVLRRVALLCCRLDGRLHTLWRWEPQTDTFGPLLAEPDLAAALARDTSSDPQHVETLLKSRTAFLQELSEQRTVEYSAVRRAILNFTTT